MELPTQCGAGLPAGALATRRRMARLSGAMIKGSHAEIKGEAGFVAEAVDCADLAGEFCGADRAKARNGIELTRDR